MKPKAKKMINQITNKRARGYRLKPATHQLIVKIQKLLKSDQDMAIASACSLYIAEFSKNIISK